MPFTVAELANIANGSLELYLDKGKSFAQNIQSKPMAAAFESGASTFSGGNENVSFSVKTGQGGGSLAGYTHDDQVTYYNPTGLKRVRFPWKEHHIGIGVSHTELKTDGITVVESAADVSTSMKDGREAHALNNLMEEKLSDLAEDYAVDWDSLIHGDGTSDTKALAGIGAFILQDPSSGSTGGLSRSVNTWWRNRAATAAANSAGSGDNKITSASTNGGVLLQYLQGEFRQLSRYARGGTNIKMFAGSDFIDALETELRANGNYTQDGFTSSGRVDGSMADVKFKGKKIIYDPTMDDLSLNKFMYVIDMKRIKLKYMQGERRKKSMPARPHDRYVMYQGLTSTAVMIAQQLNTSGIYEIN